MIPILHRENKTESRTIVTDGKQEPAFQKNKIFS